MYIYDRSVDQGHVYLRRPRQCLPIAYVIYRKKRQPSVPPALVYHFHCPGVGSQPAASETIDLTDDDDSSSSSTSPAVTWQSLEQQFLSLTDDMLPRQSPATVVSSAAMFSPPAAARHSATSNSPLIYMFPVSFAAAPAVPFQASITSASAQWSAARRPSAGSTSGPTVSPSTATRQLSGGTVASGTQSGARLPQYITSLSLGHSANPAFLSTTPLCEIGLMLPQSPVLSSVISPINIVPVSVTESSSSAVTSSAASVTASRMRFPTPVPFHDFLRPGQTSTRAGRSAVQGRPVWRAATGVRQQAESAKSYRVFRLQPGRPALLGPFLPQSTAVNAPRPQRQSFTTTSPSRPATTGAPQLQRIVPRLSLPQATSVNAQPQRQAYVPTQATLMSPPPLQFSLPTVCTRYLANLTSPPAPLATVSSASSVYFHPSSQAQTSTGSSAATETDEFVDIESIDIDQLRPIVIAPDASAEEYNLPADCAVSMKDEGTASTVQKSTSRQQLNEIICVDDADDVGPRENAVTDGTVSESDITGEANTDEEACADDAGTDSAQLPTLDPDNVINIVPDDGCCSPARTDNVSDFLHFPSLSSVIADAALPATPPLVVGDAVNVTPVTASCTTSVSASISSTGASYRMDAGSSFLACSADSTGTTFVQLNNVVLTPQITEQRNFVQSSFGHTVHYFPQYVNFGAVSASVQTSRVSDVSPAAGTSYLTAQPALAVPVVPLVMPAYTVPSLVSAVISAPSAAVATSSVATTGSFTAMAAQLVSGLRSDAMRRRATNAAKTAVHQSTQQLEPANAQSRKRHDGDNDTTAVPAKSSRYIPPILKRSACPAKEPAKTASASPNKPENKKYGETVVYHLNDDGSIEIRIEKGSISENAARRKQKTSQSGAFDAVVEIDSNASDSWCSDTFVADMEKYFDNLQVVNVSGNGPLTTSGNSLQDFPEPDPDTREEQEETNDADKSSKTQSDMIALFGESDSDSRDTLSLVIDSVEPSDDDNDDDAPTLAAVDTEGGQTTGLTISNVCSIDAEAFTDLDEPVTATCPGAVPDVQQEVAASDDTAEDLEISRCNDTGVNDDVNVGKSKSDTTAQHDTQNEPIHASTSPACIDDSNLSAESRIEPAHSNSFSDENHEGLDLEDDGGGSPLNDSGDTSMFEISLDEAEATGDSESESVPSSTPPEKTVDTLADVVISPRAGSHSQQTLEQQTLMPSDGEVCPSTQLSNEDIDEAGKQLPSIPPVIVSANELANDENFSAGTDLAVESSPTVSRSTATRQQTGGTVASGTQSGARLPQFVTSLSLGRSANPAFLSTTPLREIGLIFPHSPVPSSVTSPINIVPVSLTESSSAAVTSNAASVTTDSDKSASPTICVSSDSLGDVEPDSPLPGSCDLSADLCGIEPDDSDIRAAVRLEVESFGSLKPVAEKSSAQTAYTYSHLLDTEPVSPLAEPSHHVENITSRNSPHLSPTRLESVPQPVSSARNLNPPARGSYSTLIVTEPVSPGCSYNSLIVTEPVSPALEVSSPPPEPPLVEQGNQSVSLPRMVAVSAAATYSSAINVEPVSPPSELHMIDLEPISPASEHRIESDHGSPVLASSPLPQAERLDASGYSDLIDVEQISPASQPLVESDHCSPVLSSSPAPEAEALKTTGNDDVEWITLVPESPVETRPEVACEAVGVANESALSTVQRRALSAVTEPADDTDAHPGDVRLDHGDVRPDHGDVRPDRGDGGLDYHSAAMKILSDPVNEVSYFKATAGSNSPTDAEQFSLPTVCTAVEANSAYCIAPLPTTVLSTAASASSVSLSEPQLSAVPQHSGPVMPHTSHEADHASTAGHDSATDTESFSLMHVDQPCSTDTDPGNAQLTHNSPAVTADHRPALENEMSSAFVNEGNVPSVKLASLSPEQPPTAGLESVGVPVPLAEVPDSPARQSAVPRLTDDVVTDTRELERRDNNTGLNLNLSGVVPASETDRPLTVKSSEMQSALSVFDISVFDRRRDLTPISANWLSVVLAGSSAHDKHARSGVHSTSSRASATAERRPVSVGGHHAAVKHSREPHHTASRASSVAVKQSKEQHQPISRAPTVAKVPKKITLADYRSRKIASHVPVAAGGICQQVEPPSVNLADNHETLSELTEGTSVSCAETELPSESHFPDAVTTSMDAVVCDSVKGLARTGGSGADSIGLSDVISRSSDLRQTVLPPGSVGYNTDLICSAIPPAENSSCTITGLAAPVKEATCMSENFSDSSTPAQVTDVHVPLSEKQVTEMATRTEHSDVLSVADCYSNTDNVDQWCQTPSSADVLATEWSRDGLNARSLVQETELTGSSCSDNNDDPREADLSVAPSLSGTDAEILDDVILNFSSEKKPKKKSADCSSEGQNTELETTELVGCSESDAAELSAVEADVLSVAPSLSCTDAEILDDVILDFGIASEVEVKEKSSECSIDGESTKLETTELVCCAESDVELSSATGDRTEAVKADLTVAPSLSGMDAELLDDVVVDFASCSKKEAEKKGKLSSKKRKPKKRKPWEFTLIPVDRDVWSSHEPTTASGSVDVRTLPKHLRYRVHEIEFKDLPVTVPLEPLDTHSQHSEAMDIIAGTAVQEPFLHSVSKIPLLTDSTVVSSEEGLCSSSDSDTETSDGQARGSAASHPDQKSVANLDERSTQVNFAGSMERRKHDSQRVSSDKPLAESASRDELTTQVPSPVSDYFIVRDRVVRLMDSVVKLKPHEKDRLKDVVSNSLRGTEVLLQEELVWVDISTELNNSEANLLVEKQSRMTGLLSSVESQLQEMSQQMYDMTDAEAELSSYERADWSTESSLQHNMLLLTRLMLYKEMSALRCYHNSRLVYRLPDELCLDVERGRFVSVEGSMLFLEFSYLSLAECRQLFALKVDVEEAQARLEQLDDASGSGESRDAASRLGWLHRERRHRLDSVAVKSEESLQTLQVFLTQQLRWYRYVEFFCALLLIGYRLI